MSNTTCSVNGCTTEPDDVVRLKRGMCEKHYQRVIKYGTPDAPNFDKSCVLCGENFSTSNGRKKYCSNSCKDRAHRSNQKKKCSVPGCGGNFVARGMCNKHYTRYRKKQTPCKYEGCSNGGANSETGYCLTHHNRLKKHGCPSITMKGKYHKVKYTADGLRICTKCKTPKPDGDFHRDKGGTNGRRAACAACEIDEQKQRYEKDSERIKLRQREYRKQNLHIVRAQEKAAYKRNRDKKIELAVKHSHVRRARISKVETDKGLTRLALRKRDGDRCHYCYRVMDFSRAVGRKYHDLHATIEHLIPISQGGSHTFDNCVLACRSCNLTKNANDIEDFVGFRASEDALFELLES